MYRRLISPLQTTALHTRGRCAYSFHGSFNRGLRSRPNGQFRSESSGSIYTNWNGKISTGNDQKHPIYGSDVGGGLDDRCCLPRQARHIRASQTRNVQQGAVSCTNFHHSLSSPNKSGQGSSSFYVVIGRQEPLEEISIADRPQAIGHSHITAHFLGFAW